MTKSINKHNPNTHAGLILLGLAGLGLCITFLLQGVDVALFNPRGMIAREQHKLMLLTAALLLAIAVPTLAILYFFAWKYRESNLKASHNPQASRGKLFLFSAWAVPSVVMVVLATIMWPATRKLAPEKPIISSVKPLTIQVVAMRWKWLFIYPEQNIATVNFIQIPVGTPVKFELTADETPISSFSLPQLGSQLYALTGHQNQLNLITDTPGDYSGRSAEINGAGFAGMKFIARATSKQEFDSWVQARRSSTEALDSGVYQTLLKPTENNPAAYYSSVDTSLYDKVLMKYTASQKRSTGYE